MCLTGVTLAARLALFSYRVHGSDEVTSCGYSRVAHNDQTTNTSHFFFSFEPPETTVED